MTDITDAAEAMAEITPLKRREYANRYYDARIDRAALASYETAKDVVDK